MTTNETNMLLQAIRELNEQITTEFTDLRSQIAEVRTELKQDIAEIRLDMNAESRHLHE